MEPAPVPAPGLIRVLTCSFGQVQRRFGVALRKYRRAFFRMGVEIFDRAWLIEAGIAASDEACKNDKDVGIFHGQNPL